MLECAYWAQNQVSFDRAEDNLLRTRGIFVNDDTIRLCTNYIGQAVFDSDCRRANEVWQHFEHKPFTAHKRCILRHPAAEVAVCNGHRAVAERPGCGDRTAA